MAQSTNGIVSQVSRKPWPDRDTGKEITLHSFKIEGDDRWFRTGERDPRLNKGDSISFAADAKNNVRVDSISSVNPAPKQEAAPVAAAPTSATTARAAGSSGGQSRDGYWSAKEERDLEKDARYQAVDVPRMSFSAAQERAVVLVSAALAHDVLSFGTVKKGDKLDMLLDYVDQVADRFFLQNMGASEHLKALANAPVSRAADEQEEIQYDD